MTAYSCPACGADAVAGRERCGCGADLSLLARLGGTADAWFNRGREALLAGDAARAVEWLAAAAAARPTDAAALRLLAAAWVALGQAAAGRAALERAAAVEPHHPGLAALGGGTVENSPPPDG